MEYLHTTLTDFLIDNGTPSEDTARQIVKMIASGLEHCHISGVAHGDLKPDNILVDVDLADPGKITNLKLTDFGFSFASE